MIDLQTLIATGTNPTSSTATATTPKKTDPAPSQAQGAAMWGGISSIFTAGLGAYQMINPKTREAQVQIAQANADAAKSQASSASDQSPKSIYIIGAVCLVVVVIIIATKHK